MISDLRQNCCLNNPNNKTVRWLILIFPFFLLHPCPCLAQDIGEKEYMLIEAAEKGETAKVLSLLNDSINPNVSDWDGMTPLHYAAQNGHITTVKALVLNGAQVNAMDNEQRTPLHLSVHFNSLDIAEYLVQHQANVNAKDQYGLSPLFYASAYGDYIMTDMFLFYSEGESVTDPEGKTPFLAAVWGGHIADAGLLLRYISDIKETDNQGNNAIHLAVLNEDIEMLDSLITWGCNFNSVNMHGYSCLDLAIQENYPDVIEHLIAAGSEVNHSISKGINSLDLVLMVSKNPYIISLMENAGAVRNKRVSFSQPALSTKFSTGFRDAFSSLQMEIWEPKYGIGFDLGASQRLGRLKVLTPSEANIKYQYRETRTGFHVGIQKQWVLLRISRKERIGMNLGFDLAYFLGNNKASETPADKIWVPMPSTGLYWQAGSWQLGCSMLLQNMNTYQLSPLRFGLSVSYRFNEMK